jgi:hypothetical protein
MRAQSAAVKPFDVGRFEDEVRDVVQQTRSHSHTVNQSLRTPAPPVPEYVSHREGATEIGKLSAEAIVQEYEAAAKEIEAMGEVMKAMVQRCEQLTSSASAMLEDIRTTAERYRKEGKRIFNEIEACSTMTDDVRRLCEAFRDKITERATEPAT